MLTILAIAAVIGGAWRLVAVARASLRHLPRCNEDMVLF
jgi:hypothetical protein